MFELHFDEFSNLGYEIYNVETGDVVAEFSGEEDARDYLERLNLEPDSLDDEDSRPFFGVGLALSEEGEMVVVHVDGDLQHTSAYRLSDVEGRNLAAMIDAVLD